jgi:hypothetical protein
MPKASILRDIRRRFAAAEAEPIRQSVRMSVASKSLIIAEIYHTQSTILAAGPGSGSVGLDTNERRYKTV